MADERVALAEPLPMGTGMTSEMMGEPGPGNLPSPPSDGRTAIATFGSVITAQRVAVPRDEARVLARLKTLSAMNAHRYIYSWAVNDQRHRRKVTISGGTIKMANDLARSYGNCVIDIRSFDAADHWMFYARFVDLETGFSMTRPFQQRKAQDMGTGMDADRRRDMTFQIGASKAIRNVVLNALDTYAEFMKEECESKLLSWIEGNADRANKWISDILTKHEIKLPRVEAVVGRPRSKWTVRDIARVMTELRGVEEGLQSAHDLYPSDQDAVEVTAEKAKAAADKGKAPAKAGTKSKAKAKPENKNPDPRAEPAQQRPVTEQTAPPNEAPEQEQPQTGEAPASKHDPAIREEEPRDEAGDDAAEPNQGGEAIDPLGELKFE